MENLKDKISIESLISAFFTLKFSGKYAKAVEHDSLILDLEKQTYYWNSKGESGDIYTWVQNNVPDCKSFLSARNWLKNFKCEPHKVKEFLKEEKPPEDLESGLADFYAANLNETSIKWWNSRGVYNLDHWKVGYKKNHRGLGETSTIPFFEDGKLVNIRHRFWNPSEKFGRYMPEDNGRPISVFNVDILKSCKEITIVEGEIKFMVLSEILGECGIAISGLNAMPLKYVEILKNCSKIWLVIDPSQKSPHNLSWVKELVPHVETRIISLPNKVDDYILKGKIYQKAYKSAKLNARLIDDLNT